MEKIILKRFKESSEVKTLFLRENLPKLLDVIKSVSHAFESGNKIFFFGNGGSAADAQHLAAEFVNRYVMDRPPLPAIALTTDTSILTSVSNDLAFGEIFAKQLRALGKEGDVAIEIIANLLYNVKHNLSIGENIYIRTFLSGWKLID